MTFDELKEAGQHVVRTCSICNAPLFYFCHPVDAVALFSMGCDCSGRESYRVATHAEIAALTPVDSAALAQGGGE